MSLSTMSDLHSDSPPPKGTDPLALVSVISGALAIFSSCCCGCFTSPLSIIAIVTGALVVMKGETPSKTMGMAGVGLGVLSILFIVVSSILSIGGNLMSTILQAVQS
jgi:hypothetical protein